MLRSLNVKNIALMDNINVEFGEGLNVITGETGAGKSILVDSLNLLFGARGDKELVRMGQNKGFVQGCFNLPPGRADALEEMGLDCEDDCLILSRELTSDGRSSCRINGKMVTLSMLREVSSWLVDIHGQHEHQALLKSENHLNFLDAYAGEKAIQARNMAGKAYEEYKGIQRRLHGDWGTDEERARKIDLLKYQIDEIQMAELDPGELDELNSERSKLLNIEQIAQGLNECYQSLKEDGAALDLIRSGISAINSLGRYTDDFNELAQRMESAYYELEDISGELSEQLDASENDPRRLEQVEKRMEVISELLRKYGDTEQKALEYMHRAEEELDELLNAGQTIENLKIELEQKRLELVEKCDLLTAVRKNAAAQLSEKIKKELAELGMEKALFQIELDKKQPSQDGADRAEFMFSANPGQPLKPLTKIISGGELSRLMLAIKGIFAQRDMIPTMVFDEIDTGISGRMARVTAEKMAGIAALHQVLCVTHLAVIASMADRHYFIEKISTPDNTVTRLSLLEEEGRINEIARLTGGGETALARGHAREMLEACAAYKHGLKNNT